MKMNERNIVVVDLGSSKIAFTVAKIDNDNRQIIYHKVYKSKGIKYSEISNPKQVSEILKIGFDDAERELGIHITQVVVGLPKYKISVVPFSFETTRNAPGYIEQEEIDNFKYIAMDEYNIDPSKNEVIYSALVQSFSTDDIIGISESDIVGMNSKILNGYYNFFIGKQNALNNIETAFNIIGKTIAVQYFTPYFEAKAILLENEKKNGVALVDFGGGAVSLSIISEGTLRYYYSLPFAGNTITSDIESEITYISSELAENIKLAYGVCNPEKLFSLENKILQINLTSSNVPIQIPIKYLSEIITERVKEIINAILYEIQKSGYADKLKNGVIITGGGANLTNIANYFKELSGYNVKIGYPKPLFTISGCKGLYESSASTTIGLLLAASEDSSINCAIPQSLDEDEDIRTSYEEEKEKEKTSEYDSTDRNKTFNENSEKDIRTSEDDSKEDVVEKNDSEEDQGDVFSPGEDTKKKVEPTNTSSFRNKPIIKAINKIGHFAGTLFDKTIK